MKKIRTVISNQYLKKGEYSECCWMKEDNNKEMKEHIRNYYNQSEKIKMQENATQLDDMIKFVENYYYIGRIEQKMKHIKQDVE